MQPNIKPEPPGDEIILDQPGPSGINPLNDQQPEQVQYGPQAPGISQESMETNENDATNIQNEQQNNGSKVWKIYHYYKK